MFRLLVFIFFASVFADHVVLALHHYYIPFIFTKPSAAYLTSALRILNGQAPLYYDHPDSAYYSLLAFSLLPLKWYVWQKNFDLIEFVYWHKEMILLYLQFFTLLLSLSGLFCLYRAVVNTTKQEWAGLLALLLASECYASLWSLTSAGYLIFISGVILYLFSKHTWTDGGAEKKDKCLYLSFLALGLGFAGKVTLLPIGIFLFLALLWEIKEQPGALTWRLEKFIKCIACAAAGFFIGILPLGSRINSFFKLIYFYAVHKHGLDLPMITHNISLTISHDGFVILLLLILQIRLLYAAKSKNAEATAPQKAILFSSALLASVIYLMLIIKPLTPRYQIVTLVLVSYVVCMALSSLYKHNKIVIALLLSAAFLGFCHERLSLQKFIEKSLQANKDMDNLLTKYHADIHKDMILFDVEKDENIYFLYGNMYVDHMYQRLLTQYQPNILFLEKYQNLTYGPKGWDPNPGQWQFAIISKRLGKRFDHTKWLNARMAGAQGDYYLLVPKP